MIGCHLQLVTHGLNTVKKHAHTCIAYQTTCKVPVQATKFGHARTHVRGRSRTQAPPHEYTHAHACACVHVHYTHAHTYTYTRTRTRTRCTHTHIRIHTRTCTARVRVHVQYTYTYGHAHVHAHACVHALTRTHGTLFLRCQTSKIYVRILVLCFVEYNRHVFLINRSVYTFMILRRAATGIIAACSNNIDHTKKSAIILKTRPIVDYD